MKWLEIDRKQLAEQMLKCYEDRGETKKRGKKASEWVKQNLNYFTVGKLMKERLQAIEKFL